MLYSILAEIYLPGVSDESHDQTLNYHVLKGNPHIQPNKATHQPSDLCYQGQIQIAYESHIN